MADTTDLRDHVADWATRVADRARLEVEALTRAQMPVLSGNMQSRLTSDPISTDGTVYYTTISDDAPYAGFNDAGTQPHVIQGRPYLAFFWKTVNRDVVFQTVNHPGNQAAGWFNRGEPGGDPLATRWAECLQIAAGEET